MKTLTSLHETIWRTTEIVNLWRTTEIVDLWRSSKHKMNFQATTTSIVLMGFFSIRKRIACILYQSHFLLVAFDARLPFLVQSASVELAPRTAE